MYWFRNAIIYQLTKQIDFESIENNSKNVSLLRANLQTLAISVGLLRSPPAKT